MNFEEIRMEFPCALNSTYFDIAYDCGGANFSKKACERFFDDWAYAAANNERGGPGRATLFKTIDETREMINTLVHGTGMENVAFTKNTNEGINAILQSFDFHHGDNIVSDAMEHPSVLMPALNMKSKGVEVRLAADVEDGDVSIEEIQSLCDEHTRMVLVSHEQSATGTLIDLSVLGPWCKEHGIYLIVDAIQSLGMIPFYVHDWCVSALSAGAYKGLLGVNCVAFTYFDDVSLLAHMTPAYVAAGPFNGLNRETMELECKDIYKAQKMEDSTVDALGIYVLHDALEKILKIGIENIQSYIFNLYDHLYRGLQKAGFKLVQKEDQPHANVISIISQNGKELFDYFRSQNICLSFNSFRYVRISLAIYNNTKDIDYLLDCIEKTNLR